MSPITPGSSNGGPQPATSRDIYTPNDSEDDDITSQPQHDEAVFAEDPFDQRSTEPITFKRKQKQPARFSLSNIFSGRNSSTPQRSTSQQPNTAHSLREWTDTATHQRSTSTHADINGFKEDGPLDWYVEGPGRRVAYDDLTAIDWVFEYMKERQRKRLLYSTDQGLLGHLRQILDGSHVWAVLVITGVAVGLIAACIDIASDWLGDLKLGYCKSDQGANQFYLNRNFCCWGHEDFSQCIGWVPWRTALGISSRGGGYVMEYFFFVMFSVLFASCACILVRSFAPYAKHSGIPEIKTVLGGFVMKRFMGGWTLAIKSIGLCLAVSSGMWLGKEGPLVHVACCCANIIMKPFDSLNQNEARKREVLSAAAAAGISVAFGAPIGGVLFCLEQLSYYFPDRTMWQSFVCATIAAVTLQALDPFHTGKIVLYQVTYTREWHRFEIMFFMILGILGGVYGGLFIKLNMRIARWRKSRGWNFPILEVAFIAILTAMINFPNKFMRAQSSELVYQLFAECATTTDDQLDLCKTGAASFGVIALLLMAAVMGFFLASLSFGLEIPAGIILPSLAIGALFGRALGIGVEMWQSAYPGFFLFESCDPDIPCITPATYAIIGAASALGGATRMTISIVVIMFELTGALTYVIPIMIAVMLSKWCGDIFGKRGIYESWIHLNEYPFLDHKDDKPPPDVPASKIMTNVDDLTVIPAVGHTIETLKSLLIHTRYRGFPVVLDTSNPILLGYISRNELSYALESSSATRNLPPETQAFFVHQPFADPHETFDLRPWMDQTPITLNSRISFSIVLGMFQKLGLRYVLFVHKGNLKGLLTKKDVWFVLNGVESRREKGLGDGPLREATNSDEIGLLSPNPSDEDMDLVEGRQSLESL
ncbi:putative voltage-gated chloride channel [Talaromyces proteolyticus]|uniref:Chloride channel protein n=1 Tax=Talaromyces proteolyticus TaxID=1131652 RepID=A0AAD4Q6W6_9EURO|nr:putative voltage-gated chloride channel [Talaromyces proteolyticus]KAH8705747.1 putative voltage-gated chloride channel [Talaromyces proteolyticus]